MTFSALPRLVRMRIGPAEQAAAEFLEARGLYLPDYRVDEWVPLAEAIMEAEQELAEYDAARERGIVR